MNSPRSLTGTRPLVLLLVAVLAGLGLGRFVTAGDQAQTTTTTVAASNDLATRIGQLEAAVAAAPDDWRSLQSLGTAYVQRAAETGDAAFYSRADTALDRAEELAPDEVETTVARGLLSLALHEFDQALELGQRALDARPGSATVLGIVVDAQVELGRYDDAASTLQAMLDRDPGLPALARTSYQRELRGDLTGAIEAMRGALASTVLSGSDAASVGSLLGDLLLQAGDVEGASVAYGDARERSAASAAARTGTARLAAVRGDVAPAIAALEESEQEQPTVAGLLLLGELQRVQGDAEAAQATAGVVRAVAALQGQAGQIVDLEMALFEADAGDAVRSLALARGAHGARPDNVFTTDALAWATFRSGDTAAAAELSEQALRLGSVSPALRWHAAEIAATRGDVTAAREHLAVVLRGAPFAPAVDTASVTALAGRLGVDLPPLWTAASSA